MIAASVERKKIFLSYTLRDGVLEKSLLKGICDLLNPFYDVFADLIHNDSLDKQERVMNELHSSQYVIALETPLIRESSWVNVEIEEAQKNGIPIFRVNFVSSDVDASLYAKKIMSLINESK